MRSRLFEPVHRLAASDSGLLLGLLWGFAEALWWPVIPDFYLFAITPAAPRRWRRLALFTSAGSVMGGATGFWFAYARQNTFPMDFAPLVTEPMIHQAGSWLAQSGPAAVLQQPLSGIPYKVFVYLAGAGRLNFTIFLLASILARSLRIFAVAGVAAGLGRLAGVERVSRFYDAFLVVFIAVFSYGLWRVVASY